MTVIDVTKPEISKKKKTLRCFAADCNKKIKISDLSCRCGHIFCGKHRLPETHNCSYDFKAKGKSILIENNPQIACVKIDKI